MSKLQGLMVPLVTPLTKEREFDAEAMNQIIDKLIDNVNSFYVAGSTGEFLALPVKVRLEAIDTVIKAVDKKVPVIAGIGACAYEDVLDFADKAYDSGADIVSLQLPPYFPMTDEMIEHFFTTIVEYSKLPLMLYSIPQFNGKKIPVSVAKKFVGHPNVVGIKDSSGDLEYFESLVKECKTDDYKVFMGEETLIYEGLKRGCNGSVASIGHLYPELCNEIFDAGTAGDWDKAKQLQKKLVERQSEYNKIGGYFSVVSGIKRMMAKEGICQEYMAKIFEK